MAENNNAKAPYLAPHDVYAEMGDRPGTWRVSAVVKGQLVKRVIAARTQREAAERFCRLVNKSMGGSP